MIRTALRKLSRAIRRRRVETLPGVKAGKRLVVKGRPVVAVSNGASVVLGDDVTINSDNAGYHVSMFGPVKLMADRAGATISIGDLTRIHGSCIHAYTSITIGKRCLIAANCQIIDGDGHDLSLEEPDKRIHTRGGARPIVIEDDVWIGTGAIVLPGVRLGRGSVVGAGSVVTKDVPPQTVVAGNPARVVKTL